MNVLVQGNTMPYAPAFQAVRLPAACHLYMIAEIFPVARLLRIADPPCIIMTPLKKKWGDALQKK